MWLFFQFLLLHTENVVGRKKNIYIWHAIRVKVAHTSQLKMAELSMGARCFDWKRLNRMHTSKQPRALFYMYVCMFWCFIIQNKQTHATP